MATITVGVPDDCEDGYLGSQQYQDLLQQYEAQFGRRGSGQLGNVDAVIDLRRATWIGHLPLVALSLIVKRLAVAGATTVSVELPASGTTSAFLERWKFIALAHEHQFKVNVNAADAQQWRQSKTPRVLDLQAIQAANTSPDLQHWSADKELAHVLETAGFSDEYDVSGLADVVVHELWTNAAEHSAGTVPGFATAHVSNPDARTAAQRNAHAAEWETRLFDGISHDGVTEIVIGDAGVGFVDSLRKAAKAFEKTRPEAIAEWAFDAYSTSKQTLRQHTRGLWAVKEKIRQFRGVLYAYSGYDFEGRRGGVELFWDFFNDPLQRDALAPRETPGPWAPAGSYFQILLPHRTPKKRKTYVFVHTTASDLPALNPVALPLETAADADQISQRVATLEPHDVLFVDMSGTDGWQEDSLKSAAAAIARTFLVSAKHRLWLLNAPTRTQTILSTAEPLVELWREHGVLAPAVTVKTRAGSVVHNFLVDNENLRKAGDAGDTELARRVLVDGINAAIEGEPVTLDRFSRDGDSELTKAERNWVHDALSRNQSVVRMVSRGTIVYIEPAFDVFALSNAAFRALLPIKVETLVQEDIARQRAKEERVWYLLPGNRLCDVYVPPRFLEHKYEMQSLADEWLEKEILRIAPQMAISFSIYADRLLPLAIKALPAIDTVNLPHYKDVHGGDAVRELGRQLRPGKRAVFLVGVSGSGRTLNLAAEEFAKSNVEGWILCLLDTLSASEWSEWKALSALRGKGRFKALATVPVEKLREKPESGPEAEWRMVTIDSDSLLPLRRTSDREKKLTDGRFWRLLADAHALSRNRVIFRGQEIPTYIWPRKLLSNAPFQQTIHDEIERFDPAVLVLAEDAKQALPETLRPSISKAAIKTLDDLEGRARFGLEGMKVAALCFAASSGTEVARLLEALAYAGEAVIYVVINRMTPEIASAFIQRSRANIVSFQWLSINSPGSSHRFGRSEAVRQLAEYRHSAQSSRLLAFIDEKKEALLRGETLVESGDDADYEAMPSPSAALFDDEENYDLNSPDGISNIERLLGRAQAGDGEWVRNVLREAAARYEAWRRQGGGYGDPGKIYEIFERLFDAAASNENLEIYTVTIITLLVDRRIEPDKKSTKPPASLAALAAHVERRLTSVHDKTFVEGGDAGEHEACAAACIRALGKSDRERLIRNLPDVLRIACASRETELTLALELSKANMEKNLQPAVERALLGLAFAREEAQYRHEWLRAAGHLFADLGYGDDAEPVPWDERLKRLMLEVPDNDRTIRTLIQAIHNERRDATVVFYHEFEEGRFVALDIWPRRSPVPAPIFFENAQLLAALRAVGGAKTVYKSVRKAAATEVSAQHLSKLIASPSKDKSVLLMRISTTAHKGPVPAFKGILNVNVDRASDADELSDDLIEKIEAMVDYATKLLSRDPFEATAKMADWEWFSLVSDDTPLPPGRTRRKHVLQQWTDRVCRLLGADLARFMVLREPRWETFAISGDWTGSVTQDLSFLTNDPKFLTNIAVEQKEPFLEYDIQVSVPARPPVPWVHGFVGIPLVHEDKCLSVLNLWHHARGWFHSFDRTMFAAIGKAGAALNELTLQETRISEAKDETMRSVVLQGTKQLITRIAEADGIVHRLEREGSDVTHTRALSDLFRKIEQIFDDIAEVRTEPEIRPSRVDMTEFVRAFVDRQNASGNVAIEPILPAGRLEAEVDTVAVDNALSEIIRDRSASAEPSFPMALSLSLGTNADTIQIRLSDQGPPLPSDRLEALASYGGDPADRLVIAKRFIGAHSGAISSPKRQSGAEFLITLPTGMRGGRG